jgi:hypothetical protein
MPYGDVAAEFSGVYAKAPSGMTSGETLMAGGALMSVFGAVNGALGAYYSAQSQQNQLKMQAENLRFSARMSALNASQAEFAAQQETRAGQRAIGRYTMEAGQRRASMQASMAARGVQAGVGSAADVMASMDLVTTIDRLTMDANLVRQTEAIRSQQMRYMTQATMQGISANNLYATAGTISPYSATFSSLMGSAASIGGTWASQMRMNELIAAQSEKRMG